MISRKPNAGGGRNNKSKPQCAARARFSNWKPPSKNLKDKFKKQREVRDQPIKNNLRPSYFSDPIEKVINLANIIEGKLYGTILFRPEMSQRFIHACEMEISHEKTLDIHLSKPIHSKNVLQDDLAICEKCNYDVDIKPTSFVKDVQRTPRASDLELFRYFDAFAIDNETLIQILNLIPSSYIPVVDEVLFLLLLHLSSSDIITPKSVCQNMAPPSDGKINTKFDINHNVDLASEIEALSSIYCEDGNRIEVQVCDMLPSLISVVQVDMHLTLKDVNNLPPFYIHLRLFVYRPDIYPSRGSSLMGWLLSTPPPAPKNPPGPLSPPRPLSAGQFGEVCTHAMREIGKHQLDFESPVMFDFVEYVRSNLLTDYSHSKSQSHSSRSRPEVKHELVTAPVTQPVKHTPSDKVSSRNRSFPPPPVASGTSGTASKPSGEVLTDEKVYVAVQSCADIPFPISRPLTKHKECSEYRNALLTSINSGLVGKAAKAKALNDLELNLVLPSSMIEAILLEEEYAEMVLDRAVSFDHLGSKLVIDCSKAVAECLQINKSKSKPLVLTAKQVLAIYSFITLVYSLGNQRLMDSHDCFARDEETLRKRVIATAVADYELKFKKKEDKRVQRLETKTSSAQELPFSGEGGGEGADSQVDSDKRKRGPTLREAYEDLRVKGNKDPKSSSSQVHRQVMEVPLIITGDKKEDVEVVSGDKGLVDDEDDDDDDEDGDIDEDKEETKEMSEEDILKLKEKNRRESEALKRELNDKRRNPKYTKMLDMRTKLPAHAMKEDILRTIQNNRVVVVSGDTGCGKTTQIPQFVLDDYIDRGLGSECSIVVTQPRRISAVSVAEHISDERAEPVGQSTGYQIRLESKRSAKTRLLLMTTGVLLRRLQHDASLEGVSHVFVDEVHERDMNTDFLLIVLKRLIAVRPDVKIILMSATLRAEIFINYFRGNRNAKTTTKSCGTVSIPGRTFPVQSYFLEDAFEHTNFRFEPSSPCIATSSKSRSQQKSTDNQSLSLSDAVEDRVKASRTACLNVLRQQKRFSDRTLQNLMIGDPSILNVDLIAQLVLHIVSTLSIEESKESKSTDSSGRSSALGAVLVFVAGLSDIRDVVDALKSNSLLNRNQKLRILPLHSSLSTAEQNAIFQPMPVGTRKIVVSTNIAETSVTIDDVVYVIDTCRVKENSHNEINQFNVLSEQWVSKANMRQRRGRAGRVRSGVCYHLIPSLCVDALEDYTAPEMTRSSLDELILQIMALDMGDPYDVLSEALTPPEPTAITHSLRYLDSLNAVDVQSDGDGILPESSNLHSQITPLGFHLAALPISPRVGKLILFGVLLHCIDPVLTIAAIMSSKSPFVTPFGEQSQADESKLKFIEGDSDLLTALNAYMSWKLQFSDPGVGSSANNSRHDNRKARSNLEYDYCRSNYLSLNNLRVIDQMRVQFMSLLKSIGFLGEEVTIDTIAGCSANKYGFSTDIMKCAICAALSPNILTVPVAQRPKGESAMMTLSKKICETTFQGRKQLGQGMMSIHPSSVLSNCQTLPHPNLLYLDVLQTSKAYAKEVTAVSSLILVLFSSKMETHIDNRRTNGGYVVTVDEWMNFAVGNVSTYRCISTLRELVQQTFLDKVLHPAMDFSNNWLTVLDVIADAVK